MAKILMKGNEAIAEAAIKAGCRLYFGYPITPQNEIPEYMAKRMPKIGGRMLQAESEIAAINMVYGAAGAGARVMTSSSSPGISLKQEGLSYMAGAELPAVVVNMVRGGPGLGGIQPAQSDYFQATRGGGHGDYRQVVFTPASVQEAAEMTAKAFDIADKYRMVVMVMGDGMIGQIMEPVDFDTIEEGGQQREKAWATTGTDYHEGRNVINSLYIDPNALEEVNTRLQEKYAEIVQTLPDWEEYLLDDADIVVVAYGTTARICRNAIKTARDKGIKAGLLRVKTAWPFPNEPFGRLAPAKGFLCVEMNTGQMIEDVRLAVEGRQPVGFFGRTGGVIPTPDEVLSAIEKEAGK